MSEDVHYIGTLTEVPLVKNLEFTCELELIKLGYSPSKAPPGISSVEYLLDRLYKRYYINDGRLYKVSYKEVAEREVFSASMNKDNSINFEVAYYTGGLGFNCALDIALNTLK